jgi:hypothetical protein
VKTILVRYKTSQASAEENVARVSAVFEELRSRKPEGIRYATYRLADGVSFLHIATVEAEDHNPLLALPSFQAFQQGIQQRCVEMPVVTAVSVVGAYGPATWPPPGRGTP